MKALIFYGNESIDESNEIELEDWTEESLIQACFGYKGVDWDSSDSVSIVNNTFAQAVEDSEDGGMIYIVCLPVEPKFVVVPYSTEETATAWGSSIGDYTEGQVCITQEQMLKLSEDMGMKDVDLSNSNEELLENILDEFGVSFDKIAIVDIEHMEDLDSLATSAIVNNGSDSGWYDACDNYNEALVALSKLTLPII